MQLGLLRQYEPGVGECYIPVYNTRRFTHTWVLGKSGVGKSTALINWALQDINNGEGLAFFDPHGDAAEEILLHIPKPRRNDVIIFNPADRNFPVAFNILNNILPDRRPFVASSVVDCFKSIWGHSWGPQLEMFVYAGVAALLDVPDGTLMGLKFLLTSPAYRNRVLSHVKDPAIKNFWQTDFEEHMPEKEQRERTLSTLNKIGILISDPTIRNCIGQSRTSINLKDIMDNSRILIVSLPQGQLGIEKSSLIGALLMSHLHLTALQRTRSDSPFHVFADECHHFGNKTLIEMLSGIRKFGVSLTLAHQYLDQLTDDFRAALLGTVGTIVAFRLGAADAAILEPDFQLNRDDEPLTSVLPYHAYACSTGHAHLLKMPPTTARTYPSSPAKIRANTRHEYSTPRQYVETRITRFIENT